MTILVLICCSALTWSYQRWICWSVEARTLWCVRLTKHFIAQRLIRALWVYTCSSFKSEIRANAQWSLAHYLSDWKGTGPSRCTGKSCNVGRIPNTGRCIISYQKVLHSLPKNVNDQAHAAVLCNQSINGQLLRISALTGRLYFDTLWNICLSLNWDSWAFEGKRFFWISLMLSSLLSAILNPSFVSKVQIFVLFYSPSFLSTRLRPLWEGLKSLTWDSPY